MLFCVLDVGRAVLGTVKERYWFVPCLISWMLFQSDYVVPWLSSLGGWRLACYSRLWSRVVISIIQVSLICNGFRGLLPDNLAKCGSFGISVVSGLSVAAPEWRRGVFSLKFGLQLGHSHLSCFDPFSVGVGFVFPVVCSGEAVCWLRLRQGNISLWSG